MNEVYAVPTQAAAQPKSPSLFGDLTPLLAPRSVAIVGASDRDGNVGGTAIGYLRKFGFAGQVWPVNPGRSTVGGLPCYPSLGDLPGVPDLAILAVPADSVAELARQCADLHIPAALAWAGGFAEGGPEGLARQAELGRIAREANIRFCGPNCLGIINASTGLTASFASMLGELPALRSGNISIISQSGGIASLAHATAEKAGFGFRVMVSCGNEAVLTVSDFVRAVAQDSETKVIAVYLEGLQDPEGFIEALAEARRHDKPVVVMKGGASKASGRAALAHTGRLAGSDRAYDAIFREFSAIRVHSLEEMLDVCLHLSTLHEGRLPAGNNMAISTFGGGSGVLAVDQCMAAGLNVPELSSETKERLSTLLTPLATVGNPVDLTPQSVNDPKWRALLPEALGVIADDPQVDSYLFLAGGNANRAGDFAELVEGLRRRAGKPVTMSWLFGPDRGFADMASRGIYVFPEHARAARSLGRLARHSADRKLRLRKSGKALDFDWSQFVGGDAVISENVVAAILEKAGLPVAPGGLATDTGQAGEIADRIGFPVVAKAISPDITHRAAAGFVTLNLTSAEAVRQVDADYRRRAAELGVRYEGTWVQHMVSGDRELLVTAIRDDDFGILVGCGLGGGLTEILDDVVFARAPFDEDAAYDLIGQIRAVAGHPNFLSETQRRMAAQFVSRFSALSASAPWNRFTLEINPVKLGKDSAAAVDGLLIVE